MNPFRSSLLVSALVTAFALSTGSPAAQAANDNRDQAASTQAQANDERKEDAKDSWADTHRVSKIIGTDVQNGRGDKIGSIKDLVVSDPASGRISHAVIAVGGVLGMGDKLFAVQYDALEAQPGKDYLVLRQGVDLAKAFDDKHWPDAAAWNDLTHTAGATAATPSSAANASDSTSAASSDQKPSAGSMAGSTSTATGSTSASPASPNSGTSTSANMPTGPSSTTTPSADASTSDTNNDNGSSDDAASK
jgi:sporulation protein YlmC with PRC-barrel domain